MSIAVKRAYQPPSPADGYRILVDRLWPRGLAKAALQADEWLKDAAPSEGLRKSFHAGEIGWGAFRRRYLAELKGRQESLRRLARLSREGKLTLVFAAHDLERNNAVVLMQYLNMLEPRSTSSEGKRGRGE